MVHPEPTAMISTLQDGEVAEEWLGGRTVAGLPLVRTTPPDSSGSNSLSMEVEMDGDHVIWGEIESLGGSHEARSPEAGSSITGSHLSPDGPDLSSDGQKLRKLQNKRLMDPNIQFRRVTSSFSHSGGSRTEESRHPPGSSKSAPGSSKSGRQKSAAMTFSEAMSTLRQPHKLPTNMKQQMQVQASGSGSSSEQPQVALGKASAQNASSVLNRAFDFEQVREQLKTLQGATAASESAKLDGQADRRGMSDASQLAVPETQEGKDRGKGRNISEAAQIRGLLLPAEVSPEELAEITARVRRNEDGEPTSLGSEGHDANCKVCLFVFSPAGCENGVLCTFCHFNHKRAHRPRPCKGKRNRFRKLVARVEQLRVGDALEQPPAPTVP